MPKLTEKDKMMLGMERAGELEDYLGRTPSTAELNKFLKTGKLPKTETGTTRAESATAKPKTKPVAIAPTPTTPAVSTPEPTKVKTKSKTKSKKRTRFYYRQSYGALVPAKATNLKGLIKEVQSLVVKEPDKFPDGTVLELLQAAETFTVKHSISFKK